MNNQQQQLAALIPAILAKAEGPRAFASPRDGSVLRLVAPNERLGLEQLQNSLQALLCQPHMLQLIASEAGPHLNNSNGTKGATTAHRHIAAWLRGCCYLTAGNSKQALRDARTALAYAAAAAAAAAAAPTSTTSTKHTAQTDNTAALQAPTSEAQSHTLALTTATAALAPSLSLDVGWFPALLLAGEAYSALGDSAQAVVHLAKAQRCAPDFAADGVSVALQQAVRGLTPDQGYAWAMGRAEGLVQQLQDEADTRLPEVMRPRPKWYYYNQWTRQRIHLTLLELHLAALMPPPTSGGSSSSSSSGNNNSAQNLLGAGSGDTCSSSGSSGRGVAQVTAATSTSSARGRLLLGLLAEGSSGEVPAVAAAAAAAGFELCAGSATGREKTGTLALTASADDTTHAAAAASSETGVLTRPSTSAALSSTMSAHSTSGSGALQLPEPVVSKLLSVDAGDLDLMLQHPVALQGQVYELLDVLQSKGPDALEAYTIQPLSWTEVQGLAGPGLVGLPLGYTPTATPAAHDLLALPPAPSQAAKTPSAALPATASAAPGESAPTTQQPQQLLLPQPETGVLCEVVSGSRSYSRWHRPGFTRSQYVLEAAAAAAAKREGQV